ncbi:unnamed protein product [Brugia pahangi]|uniref:Transposase n=1 Tax=Brugia pahangi TaxID=6280 RepID=A0A0N4T7J2_BRUPA|nr:unnamed protein product [Brugia pahangi]
MVQTPSEQVLTREETRQQHEARKRIIEEKIMRLKLHIGTLEKLTLTGSNAYSRFKQRRERKKKTNSQNDQR